VSLNATQFNLSRVLGPTIAGVVMSSLGAIGCFAINAATYVPFLAGLAFLPPAPRPRREGASKTAETPSILDAVKAALKRPRLRRSLTTVFVSGLLCGPAVTFFPVFAETVLHAGVKGFGQAVSAYGVGGLIGAGAVLAIPDQHKLRASVGLAVLNGALVIGLATQSNFLAFMACAFGAGAVTVASNTAANAHLQSSIPDTFRGRVSSLYTLALRGSLALGNVVAGASIGVWGARPVFITTGSLALAIQFYRLVFDVSEDVRPPSRRNDVTAG
jgi:predicted MFS family arabinose efflux permease